MTIVLKTSSTASMQRMCVSQDTPDLRGRAHDDRAQDLDTAPVRVVDTHGVRCGARSRSGPQGRPGMRRLAECVSHRHTGCERLGR